MTYDFLIIGGGIAGQSVAARVSHLGKVLLLEAEDQLGYHTSGRSAALFEVAYGHPVAQALNAMSEEYHRAANGGILSPRGLMLLGKAGEEAEFERERRDMGMEVLSFEQALDIVPILNPETVAHIGYHAEAWDMDTDRLMQNFAKEARGNGGDILTGQQVTAISRTADGWRVETAKGTFEARILINAAGAWVDKVAEMAGIAPIGFTPNRRSMAQIPSPGGRDSSRWPMMLGVGEHWYSKPQGGRLLVSPAEEDPQEPHDAWAEDMVLAEGLARYEEMVTEPVARLEASWAGLRTFAPDRVMVIGFDPTDPAFFWHAGQGGNGFQTAPAASQLAADLIAGTTPAVAPDLVAALSPARFRT